MTTNLSGADTMLELALKANVPIITCRTTDTVNAAEIIAYLANKDIYEVMDFDVDAIASITEDVIVTSPQTEVTGTFEELYSTLVTHEKTIVFINTEYESSLFMDCGLIPVPDSMARDIIKGAVNDDLIDGILSALGGMDLKTIGEVIRLTATRDHTITIKGVIATRKLVAPSINGLTQLSTALAFYIPKPDIEQWVQKNKPYFLKDVDARLRPRGLLFTGKEGCGKTQGAKYVADHFEVPLYLLNLADLITRWYGESETHLRAALQTLDAEEPCIVLIDEVEKVFASNEEGTTSRMLSQLLWWMQERTTRVLVIMTCNNLAHLPKELYREQRIDRTVEFSAISNKKEAIAFMEALAKTFNDVKVPTVAAIRKAIDEGWEEEGIRHSTLTQRLTDMIKELNEETL